MTLYYTTRFERASRSHYHFGSLYRGDDGIVYIYQAELSNSFYKIENMFACKDLESYLHYMTQNKVSKSDS